MKKAIATVARRQGETRTEDGNDGTWVALGLVGVATEIFDRLYGRAEPDREGKLSDFTANCRGFAGNVPEKAQITEAGCGKKSRLASATWKPIGARNRAAFRYLIFFFF